MERGRDADVGDARSEAQQRRLDRANLIGDKERVEGGVLKERANARETSRKT